MAECKICGKNVLARLLCRSHYYKAVRDGTIGDYPLPDKHLPEDQRKSRHDINADYYARNRDAELARGHAYYVANKERINKKATVRAAQWRANNLERDRANRNRRKKERRLTDAEYREKEYQFFLEWRRNNHDRWVLLKRAGNQRRRVRITNADGEWPLAADDIIRLFDTQAGLCPYCGVNLEGGFHIDHKTPISRGGDNKLSNLQLLCPCCNVRKGAKTHEEFAARLAGDAPES